MAQHPSGELEQAFFRFHDSAITSMAQHPSGELVATGQGASLGSPVPTVAIWSPAE
ncbi:hypothetical protein T484DRAFT_1781091, partial [Baffinella frigidus]